MNGDRVDVDVWIDVLSRLRTRVQAAASSVDRQSSANAEQSHGGGGCAEWAGRAQAAHTCGLAFSTKAATASAVTSDGLFMRSLGAMMRGKAVNLHATYVMMRSAEETERPRAIATYGGSGGGAIGGGIEGEAGGS